MSKISDELRDYGRRLVSNASPFNCTFGDIRAYQDELADRIDREMLELPRDADGVPINLGDEVCLNGKNGRVTHIDYRIDEECHVIFWADRECIVCMKTELAELTHNRPDSWERIADELDEMVDASDSADDRCEKLADLAERIRKLAEKEGER